MSEPQRIAIASDHGGFEAKQALAEYLRDAGHDVTDLGTFEGPASVDYPEYAIKVASAVARGDARFGILVCGTGIGMAIAANKVRGIRAANVTDPAFARLAREHNDANVLTLSGRFVSLDRNREIVDAFIGTEFDAGGRHSTRVGKIMDAEKGEQA